MNASRIIVINKTGFLMECYIFSDAVKGAGMQREFGEFICNILLDLKNADAPFNYGMANVKPGDPVAPMVIGLGRKQSGAAVFYDATAGDATYVVTGNEFEGVHVTLQG